VGGKQELGSSAGKGQNLNALVIWEEGKTNATRLGNEGNGPWVNKFEQEAKNGQAIYTQCIRGLASLCGPEGKGEILRSDRKKGKLFPCKGKACRGPWANPESGWESKKKKETERDPPPKA